MPGDLPVLSRLFLFYFPCFLRTDCIHSEPCLRSVVDWVVNHISQANKMKNRTCAVKTACGGVLVKQREFGGPLVKQYGRAGYLSLNLKEFLLSLQGQQQTFQFPDIFPEKEKKHEEGSVEEMQEKFMEDERQRQKPDPRRGGVTEWFGL
uniref:Uncharacterized protein n=1 Tax=Astyanax mexicanus TaxID=7994 RepID=A0A3B1K0G9_ASTMX